MRSVQDKFFALLEERADAVGLEVVQAANWANTGTLHLQDPNSFGTTLSVRYDFQPKDVTLGDSSRNAPVLFPDRPNPKFAIFTPAELDVAIAYLLTAAKQPVA